MFDNPLPLELNGSRQYQQRHLGVLIVNLIMSTASTRQSIINRRQQLSPTFQLRAAHAAFKHLVRWPIFLNAKHIALYFPFNGELDTRPIIAWCQKNKKHCYLPKMFTQGAMSFHKIPHRMMLTHNHVGIAEPSRTMRLIHPRHIDLVITPLVAFDKDGNRIGMGAGYYDRYFHFKQHAPKKKPILCGYAYDFQYVSPISKQAWDIPLDYLISEKTHHSFKRRVC